MLLLSICHELYPYKNLTIDMVEANSRIIVSRRSWSSVRLRWLFFLGVNALGVCCVLVWMDEWFEHRAYQVGAESRLLWRVWSIPAFFLPFSLLPFFIHPGSWIIDAEAITYIPQFGQPRKLKWSNVVRVMRSSEGLILNGEGRKISLRRPGLVSGIDRVAWNSINSILSKEFDLKPVKLWYTRSELMCFLSGRAREVTALVIAFVVWMLIWLGLMAKCWVLSYAYSWSEPDPFSLTFSLFVLQLMGMLLLIVVPTALAVQRPLIREARRIHPEYPWRVRRPEQISEASNEL